MKKKYGSLIKNIGLFTIGSLGSKIVAFLMLPLYTAILTANDYGIVDVMNSSAYLLMPILLLSITDAVLRFGMDPDYEKSDTLSTTIKILLRGTTVLILGIGIINALHIFKVSIGYWIYLLVVFVLGSLNNIFVIFLKTKNKASIIAISGIAGTLVTCLSNIICLIFLKLGINGYMISNALGLLIQLFLQLIIGKIYLEIHFKNYNDLSKPMIKYSTPLIANSIAWWINNASDRYILTAIKGADINGIYSISYKIPTILTTFQGIFYNAWSISAISEYDEKDSDGFLGNNYVFYSFLSIFLCSIIILFNIPLAKVLYSGEFYKAWQCVPFLLVGTVFNGIAQFEGAFFAAAKKTKEVSLSTFIGAIVNIILNFVLIIKIGPVGAALSTMVGYFITWMLRTIFLSKFASLKVEWKIQIIAIILLISQAIIATYNKIYFMQIIIIVLILMIHLKYIKMISNIVLEKIKSRSDS